MLSAPNRCDGCAMSMPGGRGIYQTAIPGYLWCLLLNARQGLTAPVVMDASHIGLPVLQVRPDHYCGAWTPATPSMPSTPTPPTEQQ